MILGGHPGCDLGGLQLRPQPPQPRFQPFDGLRGRRRRVPGRGELVAAAPDADERVPGRGRNRDYDGQQGQRCHNSSVSRTAGQRQGIQGPALHVQEDPMDEPTTQPASAAAQQAAGTVQWGVALLLSGSAPDAGLPGCQGVGQTRGAYRAPKTQCLGGEDLPPSPGPAAATGKNTSGSPRKSRSNFLHALPSPLLKGDLHATNGSPSGPRGCFREGE